MTNFNPIKRMRLKPKAKQCRENAPWRPRKVRLDAAGMLQLRSAVFTRSGMRCENSIDGIRCPERFGWFSFQAHHMLHRSLGGSDCRENILCLCLTCHDLHHRKNAVVTPYKGWQP